MDSVQIHTGQGRDLTEAAAHDASRPAGAPSAGRPGWSCRGLRWNGLVTSRTQYGGTAASAAACPIFTSRAQRDVAHSDTFVWSFLSSRSPCQHSHSSRPSLHLPTLSKPSGILIFPTPTPRVRWRFGSFPLSRRLCACTFGRPRLQISGSIRATRVKE